jgi:hypothetical protein
MHLLIDGELRELIPIKHYRTLHNLPDSFTITTFEPKAEPDLASLDHTPPQALQSIHENTLKAIKKGLSPIEIIAHIDILTPTFDQSLRRVNDQIGLKDVEIEFAVSGFDDALRRWGYALITPDAPTWETVHAQWLMDSVRISGKVFDYPPDLIIQIISTIYGRVGLRIKQMGAVDYVLDRTHACPAEGFMTHLMRDVAHALITP